MSYRAGFLALIGQPNAGKSTLMNHLVNEKVSIVSSKPQTTRRRVVGLHSNDQGQIVFVDSPGLIQAERGLNGFLAREAREVMTDADAVVAVVSPEDKNVEAVQKTLELVKESGKPWLGVITKADLQDKGHRLLILRNMIEAAGGKALVVSALRNDRDSKTERDELLAACLALLPESPAPLYDIELFTPQNERELVAEIIREKCFDSLHQEIPFSLFVRIILYDELAEPIPRIAAEIVVGKDNHKGMVIGKGGEVLKQIGSSARKDIEKLLGHKIFLELKVSAREGWSENKRMMKELGYAHDESE